MKKPLIILVDDEPAVLEALETTLSSVFSEICKIESYDDPRDVLTLNAMWSKDQRPVALAIVDQKMPYHTGVELLRRWKESEVSIYPGLPGHSAETDEDAWPPFARMRTLVLTGYASLDAALEAKNEAGVDRFLQKPWDKAALVDEVGTLLRQYFIERELLAYLKEVLPKDVDTIARALRLRYKVYRMLPPLAALVPFSPDEAHVDPYDTKSILLALIYCDGQNEELIGTIRITTQADSPQLENLTAACRTFPAAGRAVEGTRHYDLPMLDVFRDRVALEAFLKTLESQGAVIGEIGRHAILPEYRNEDPDLYHLLGTIGFVVGAHITHCVAGVHPFLAEHYRAFQFTQIDGVRKEGGDYPAVAIAASAEGIKTVYENLLPAFQQRLTRTSETQTSYLCFCPSFPECVTEPYVTGNFETLDVFCPLKAHGLLRAVE